MLAPPTYERPPISVYQRSLAVQQQRDFTPALYDNRPDNHLLFLATLLNQDTHFNTKKELQNVF